MFRLLVQWRTGRYPQISCSKGTCLLQHLSKVSKSLLYTARVIMIAQKSGPCSSEFGLPNFSPRDVLPRWGRRCDRRGLEAGKEAALCSWGVIRDKNHTDRKGKGSLITSPPIMLQYISCCRLYITSLFSLHIFNCWFNLILPWQD